MSQGEIYIRTEWVVVCPHCSHVFSCEQPDVNNYNTLGSYRMDYNARKRIFVNTITKHLHSHETETNSQNTATRR